MAEAPNSLERVRPCLSCGNLIPFSAMVCEACGEPGPDQNSEEERVQFCLSCGAIVAFHVKKCPQCGSSTREQSTDKHRLKACQSCLRDTPFQNLYCDHCGQLSVEVECDEIPPIAAVSGGTSGLQQASFLGAVFGVVAGLGLLIAAVARMLV